MELVHPVQMGLLTINNRQFRLYEGVNTIGRNREAVVNIKHVIISQNHAIIMIFNGQYFISDLKSNNGSYLNDMKLTPLKLYPLTNNSKVTLGNLPGAFSTTMNAPAEDQLADNLAPTQSFFEGSTQLMEQSVSQGPVSHDEPTQEMCWSGIHAVKPLKTVTLYDLPPPGPHFSQIHDEHLAALESIGNCPKVVDEPALTAEAAQVGEQAPELLEQPPESNEAALDNTEANSALLNATKQHSSLDANSDDEATDCEENCDNCNVMKARSKGNKVSSIITVEAAFCDKSNESLEFLNCEKSLIKATSEKPESPSSLDESLAFKRTRKSFMVISTQDFDDQNNVSNGQGNSSETETYQQFEDTIPATQDPPAEELDESDVIAATQAATASAGSESKSQNTESEVFKLGLTQLMDQNHDSMPETSLNMFGSPAGGASQEIQTIFDVATGAEQSKSFTEEGFLAPTQKIAPSSKTVFTLANNEYIYGAPTQKANVEDSFDLFEAPTQKIGFLTQRMDDSFLQPTQKIQRSFTSEALDANVDYDSRIPLERNSATAEDIFLAPTQKIRWSSFRAAAEEDDDDDDLFLAPTQKLLSNSSKSGKRPVDPEAADIESKRLKKMFSFKKKACNLDASLSVLADDESKSDKTVSSDQMNRGVEGDKEVDVEASNCRLLTVEKCHTNQQRFSSCEATSSNSEEGSRHDDVPSTKVVINDRPEGVFKRVSGTCDTVEIFTGNLEPVEKARTSRLRRMTSQCGGENATEANTKKNENFEEKVEDGAKGTMKSVSGTDDDIGASKSNLKPVDKSRTKRERQHAATEAKSQEVAELQEVEGKHELKSVSGNGDDDQASRSNLEVVEEASSMLLKKTPRKIEAKKTKQASKPQDVTVSVGTMLTRRKLNTSITSEALKECDVSTSGSTSINQSMALLESKMAKTKKSTTTEKIKISFPKDRKSMELSVVEKDKPEDQSEAPKPNRGRHAAAIEKVNKSPGARRDKTSEPVEALSSTPSGSKGSSSSQETTVLSEDKKAASKRGCKEIALEDLESRNRKLCSKRKMRGNRKDAAQAKEAPKVARLAISPQRSIEDRAAADLSLSKKPRLSVTSPDIPQRGTLRKQRHKVVFTMMDSPQLESLIKQLGGSIVDSVEACTVLVTQQVKRSQKLLVAIGLGRPICTPQWITDSKKAKQFLDPWDHLLTDLEAETKWSFSLKESLQRGRAINLLKSYHFYIQVTDAVDALKGAIQACGGKWLSRIPSGPLEHAYVISSADNQVKHRKIVQKHPYLRCGGASTLVMEQAGGTMCPVCTLYLRPGITLKHHLTSHPKQKVIEALVQFSTANAASRLQATQPQTNALPSEVPEHHPNMPPHMNQFAVGHPSNMGTGHFFMYQQSMSASTPHQSNVSPMPLNPFAQQYLVPAVYNPQMMPYFYQQQQLIMSSNGLPPPPLPLRALPLDPVSVEPESNASDARSPAAAAQPREKDPEKEQSLEKGKLIQSDLSQDESITATESEEDTSHLKQQNSMNFEAHLDEEEDCSSIESDHDLTDSEYKHKLEPDRSESTYLTHDDPPTSDDQDYQFSPHETDCEPGYHDMVTEEHVNDPLHSHSSGSNRAFEFPPSSHKACQTPSGENFSLRPVAQNVEHSVLVESKRDDFFIEQRSNMSCVYTSDDHQSYEQSEPIYTSANIINNTEGLEFITIDEMRDMQVTIGDFSHNSSSIPAIDHNETDRSPNSPILVTITAQQDTNMGTFDSKDYHYVENVNIQSDEKMPPRGELSEQESMGSTNDMVWGHLYHYQEPDSVGSYEHNSWDDNQEVSEVVEEDSGKANISTVDIAALKQEPKDTISTSSAENFKMPPAPVGLDINKKKVKKLVIKPKPKKEVQASFDNLFTSRLKVEVSEESADDAKPDNKDDIKTATTTILMCKICDLNFKTRKELGMHNRALHNYRRLKVNKCEVCKEHFDLERAFNEHLKIHPLECKICGKLFYRKYGLKLHTSRHLGIKPFKCDLCDKAFLVKQKLEEHRNCHTGNRPIKCSMCPATFKRYSNLIQHRNKHHYMIPPKTRDFICFCGKLFQTKKKLAWHREIHDPKPKSCTECSEKFIHMASLTRHMRRAHNSEYLPDNRNPSQVNTECPLCKGTYLKTSLDAHLRTHTNIKQFSCPICSKEFSTKWNLKLHRYTHESRTQKPFKCALCRGAFIRESDFISHMNSHKNVQPYTCNYCGAKFIRKYNCQRHVKEHENVKMYNCEVCGKSFHRSYYLKDHMRVHSGDRPYSCHICGKTSTTKSNHNKHVNIHHAREPVSTET